MITVCKKNLHISDTHLHAQTHTYKLTSSPFWNVEIEISTLKIGW